MSVSVASSAVSVSSNSFCSTKSCAIEWRKNSGHNFQGTCWNIDFWRTRVCCNCIITKLQTSATCKRLNIDRTRSCVTLKELTFTVKNVFKFSTFQKKFSYVKQAKPVSVLQRLHWPDANSIKNNKFIKWRRLNLRDLFPNFTITRVLEKCHQRLTEESFYVVKVNLGVAGSCKNYLDFLER